MTILSLIPPQVKIGVGIVLAGVIFWGGWQVESWRAADALEAEKLQHQADIVKLQSDWTKNMEAANEARDAAEKERDINRAANDAARQQAEVTYEKDRAQRVAAAGLIARDNQRLRDELAAAQVAGRSSASGGNPVSNAGSSTPCSGASGDAACGFIARAIDLAKRCVEMVGEQHAALVETLNAWPKK